MVSRKVRITLCVMTAGTVLASCGLRDAGETRAEKRYVKICSQYIGEKYDRADDLCRCQWKAIRAKVPPKELDEFFFKLTAGRRFETGASRLVDAVSAQCLRDMGASAQ